VWYSNVNKWQRLRLSETWVIHYTFNRLKTVFSAKYDKSQEAQVK